MVITKTPFRISLFGGGTDYPEWYKEHDGKVLSMAIDKYCYVTCRYLPPFFNHKYRVMYAKVENAKAVDDIQHPAVRAVIKYLGIEQGLEIHHDADLPARSGTGSSSSFVVGLLNGLLSLTGISENKFILAQKAILIERELMKEKGGVQDQIAVALGGLNKITFSTSIWPAPVKCEQRVIDNLLNHMMLFYTGLERSSSEVAETLTFDAANMTAIAHSVDRAEQYLQDQDFEGLGALLSATWMLKRQMSLVVSNSTIDYIYGAGMTAGAYGGKLLGAGGGGFFLFIAPPKAKAKIKEVLSDLIHVPFSLDLKGTQVIFNNEV